MKHKTSTIFHFFKKKKSGKWNIYLDESSSTGELPQRECFSWQAVGPWLVISLCVLAGLGSGEWGWYDGGPSGLWPKLGFMRERSREGAVGGVLGKR